MKKFYSYLYLFLIGAAGYSLLEILWRGFTHWAMAIDGGICLVIIGAIDKSPFKSRTKKALLCALCITVIEFISGLLLNLVLKWNVWDYSNMKFNLLGQISLLYSVMWFFLSGAAILLDDWIRWVFFGEDRHPRYHLF